MECLKLFYKLQQTNKHLLSINILQNRSLIGYLRCTKPE